jgi:UDP-N-acetylglucosamine--dolichyl-phosphate N-acetylglucosaminephosphotransferase
VLPTVASLPLLVTYAGGTAVLVPPPLRAALAQAEHGPLAPLLALAHALGVHVDAGSAGAVVDLGVWYFVYMGLLAVFSTNALNIFAGVNGLEAGQALVIAAAVLFANVLEMSRAAGAPLHAFSASLMAPFAGVTAALLRHNWWPADVFVGDTFCYFAGMTFAVVAILGHFSKTLLLFFGPQIANFVYSTPQLFGLYPCPRHRLPAVDPATGKLVPSTFEWQGRRVPNMTLLCAVLRVTGPLHERDLVRVVLALQTASCALGLLVRYVVSTWVYPA